MIRTPVTSSIIAAIGYDPANKLLQIQFKPKKGQQVGDVYEYQNVTAADYSNLTTGDSIGSAFIHGIKADPKRWPHRKLSAEEAAQ